MKHNYNFILLLAVLFGVVHNGSGALYGLITGFGGDSTQTVVLTVQVDPVTGNFTSIAENFIYVGSSATYDGISGFDQKNKYFYYATNFESAFVFGVDVIKGELLPPVSIGSEAVTSIDWDGTGNQLLINGLFLDESSAIFTLPYSGPSVELINFTTMGITTIYATVLDWKKDIYYLAFYNDTSSQFEIGTFALAKPTAIVTTSLGCGAAIAPDFLFYDSANGILLGIGFNSTALAYKYFEVVAKKCTVTDLKLTGIVTSATYDPTVTTLYLGYVDSSGSSMISYNRVKKTLSKVSTLYVLEDLQASYAV